MSGTFQFTFSNIEKQYKQAIVDGYLFVTCEEYASLRCNNLSDKTIIHRIDVDYSIKKAERLGEIFNKLGIKASFFIRLHAPEYNPFSFENYRIIKFLIDSGHEIGYHSEVIDQEAIWQENAEENLIRDIDVINRIFNIEIKGTASHGGMTGLNNKDFWKERKAETYGLMYEAYEFLKEAFYISDSEWTQWKCYDKGVLVKGERKTFGEHLKDGHPLIYLLIHSDTYFDHNFYE
jgi:hypothetical protein